MAKNNDKGSKSGSSAKPAETAKPAVESTAIAAVDQLGVLDNTPIHLIDAKSFKNQRTGDFTVGDSKEDGTDQSFAELVGSIEDTGQKDPITIRRKRGTVDNGKPFEVIKGFRRFAAVNFLAQSTGTEETATIKTILKDLTDLEALEENIFENTARDNLTGPDLAWAAYNLQQSYLAHGQTISDNQLAKLMGKNQAHISKIKKIVTLAPTIAKAWQEAKSPLTVDTMKRISEIDGADKQETEYQRVVTALGGKGSARGGTKPPLETASNQATKIATLLGNLESQGLIKTDINWEANLGALGVKLGDLTVQDVRIVAKLAIDAFAKAKEPKPAKAAAEQAAAAQAEEPAVSAEN